MISYQLSRDVRGLLCAAIGPVILWLIHTNGMAVRSFEYGTVFNSRQMPNNTNILMHFALSLHGLSDSGTYSQEHELQV